MRFVVIGGGGVGGPIAARAHAAGRDVLVVARGAHGAAIRARGLTIEAPDGVLVARVPCVASVAEVAWRPDDRALLAVKTQDVAGVVGDIAVGGGGGAPVACLTNGLEAERICARVLPEVHAVCVMAPAEHVEPGLVRQWTAPVRGVLDVGRYPSGCDAADADLASLLRAAGYVSEPTADILRWKRSKLLVNLGNALEAVCGPTARDSELAKAAVAEARAVFAAAGLSLVPAEDEVARRTLFSSGPIPGAARRGGSTWQSLSTGRPLETDYLNGEIVLLGRLHGVATPINAAFAAAARRARAPHAMALDDVYRLL